MRYGLVLFLVSLFLIVGCTQDSAELTCEQYCPTLPHVQCVGEWNISGVYPDCVCNYVCETTDVNVSNGAIDCVANWTCTDWSVCSRDGVQSRTCIDVNYCNTSEGKPSESQSCEVENPCEGISDESLRAECEVLFFFNAVYCDEDSYASCIYDLSKITLNESLCEEINSSFDRNTCKAIVNYDKSKCNILQPDLRSLCRSTVNNYLKNRAVYEVDDYYCDLIDNNALALSCESLVSNVNKYNYTSNASVCGLYDFTNSTTDYQRIFSCFTYQVKQGVDPCGMVSVVENMTDVFMDECEALVDNDITYCYDLNTSERDRCFAHFAYLRDEPLICRDAASRDECLNILGKYFGDGDQCREISAKVLRNSCLYALATQCLPYNWKECNVSYCAFISDNKGLKDVCIYNVIDYDAVRSLTYKDYI